MKRIYLLKQMSRNSSEEYDEDHAKFNKLQSKNNELKLKVKMKKFLNLKIVAVLWRTSKTMKRWWRRRWNDEYNVEVKRMKRLRRRTDWRRW